MKRGLIGPYSLGILSGFSCALKIAEEITGQPSSDVEAIVYATAFQAGVDEFLLGADVLHRPQNKFLAQRTTLVPNEEYSKSWNVIVTAFSAYLPDGWLNKTEFAPVWALHSFLADLLDAMSRRASLLAPAGIPALPTTLLPNELAIPVGNLLATISDIQTPGLILQKSISGEDTKRYVEIISSDAFVKYTAAQAELDSAGKRVSEVMPGILATAEKLYEKNSSLLDLRKSAAGILKITPKVIDAIFGKLPGALAEFMANIGVDLIGAKRSVVIYDFSGTIKEVFLKDFARMIHKKKE